MIGKIIKNMRLSIGLSQAELGKILNMADTTISSYERENSQASFDTIMRIAKICEYEILFKDRNNNLLTPEEMEKDKDF